MRIYPFADGVSIAATRRCLRSADVRRDRAAYLFGEIRKAAMTVVNLFRRV
jgi:hypothetical protein